MIIDCDSCAVRGLECGDCVVTVLLRGSADDLDNRERAAIAVLAEAGMLPPLRLVASDGDDVGQGPPGDGRPAPRPTGGPGHEHRAAG
jgi:hypothetical protein